MQTFDFRDPSAVLDEDESRTYVLLGSGLTCLFHWERGNVVPWHQLRPALEAKLPGGWHTGLGDVTLASPAPDIAIDARCGHDAAAWFCQTLLERRVSQASAPVALLHADGEDEYLGQAGAVAAGRTARLAA